MALGASKPTVALTPSKASYTANLSLFALSPPSLLRLLRCTMFTPRTPMSTPRFVLSCLTSPCHPSFRLRTQVPLYSSPFSIASSGPLYLRPRFYCATKTLISTLKTSAFKTETLISTPKTTISTPESLMPTSLYLQPRGFREIRLPCFHSLSLRLTLAVSTLVVSFHSTHHSVFKV